MDPVDPGVMRQPPRAPGSGVITPRMWLGIGLVGIVMACGTLLVLDGSLPGGLIAGTGTLSHAQARAFTTLVLFQLCNVFNARSDTQSAFRGVFRNRWLWGAVVLSLGLHALVIYVPPLQKAFNVSPLTLQDWLLCTGVASTVLWLRELSKLGSTRPE
jgi:Ca2+-transporting ATPase